MKTTILIILLLTSAATFVNAQARLGSSFTEIKEEFSDPKYKLMILHHSDMKKYIHIQLHGASIEYYFNDSNICIWTVILPASQGALNYYVEEYNKKYVILSPTKWRMYSDQGYAEIELTFTDNGKYYFIWTYI